MIEIMGWGLHCPVGTEIVSLGFQIEFRAIGAIDHNWHSSNNTSNSFGSRKTYV
jgi:hypothetical protein